MGDPFDWLEAIPVLAIVTLALTGVLPPWTLTVALVLCFRRIYRLLVWLASAADG